MNEQKCAIALGFFDGVHLGHAKLLELTLEVSREKGLVPAVYTFDRHPAAEITGKPVLLLNSTEDREYLFREIYGMKKVVFDRFDRDLMNTDCRTFIRDILAGRLNAAHLVAGWDYTFGKSGEGNAALLKAEADALGIGCDIVEKVVLNGITISSTYIRNLVANGDMENAGLYLGHAHMLSGNVIPGNKLGRKLGIPTVNLPIPPSVQPPAKGVYITRVHIPDDARTYAGITNVGTKPTVAEDGAALIETHIMGYEGDLYGKKVRLEFLKYLRPEIRFPNLELLKEQILEDMESARAFLQGSLR